MFKTVNKLIILISIIYFIVLIISTISGCCILYESNNPEIIFTTILTIGFYSCGILLIIAMFKDF